MNELVVTLLAGMVIGAVLLIVISNISHHLRSLKNSNGMTLGPVKDKLLCKQPHSWMKVYLLGFGKNGNVNMCRICGYIAGSKMMASQEMIDRLEDLEQKQKVEDELFGEFVAQENKELQAWFDAEIKGGVDLNKLVDLHNAGQTFQQRFQAYLEHRQRTGLPRKDT